MPTEMELTLEQTQQGVSYEVSVDPHGSEGYLKMVVEVDPRGFVGYSKMEVETSATLIPDEVLMLKNFKKDATLKLFKSPNQERYEHVSPEVTSPQDGKVIRWRRDCAWLMISRCSRSQCQIQVQGTSSI
ncbi:hypothetical protein Tco_0749341 [Tanacetum coccineum]|uniref:Uncharacterized protein n=1 Tax=Tanacetum coccineum TaxID=301880 RepID=A0ABQ4YYC5_9ASTR